MQVVNPFGSRRPGYQRFLGPCLVELELAISMNIFTFSAC
jgi:hypothetical protein